MSGGLVSRAGASSRSRALRVAGSIALAIGLASCLAPVHRPRIRILGAVETVRVAEAGLFFNATIEPKRRSTAIHATDLQIEEAANEPRRNIGKRIRFFIQNELGERQVINTRISGLSRFDTSGSETDGVRYLVPLTLEVSDIERLVEVELANKGADPHKLQIGRDWVGEDLRVDPKQRGAD